MDRVRRRLVGAALAALFAPGVARAEVPERVYRVAWAEIATGIAKPYYDAFRDGLAQRGFSEGRNLELRAFGGLDKKRSSWDSPGRVEEILAWKPDAILVKSVKAVAAFKKFAPEKPIVFAWVPDPVGAGIVESLVRPGGNATGVSMPLREFALKRIELLREILPRARRFAVLFDSRSDTEDETLALIDGAALRAGLQAVRVDVGAAGIAEAFARIRRTKCEAVLITGVIEDPRYLDLAVKFQEEAKIPFLDDAAESAEAGMVLGLGEDSLDHFRRAAGVTALLLRGGSPSTTPVDISRRIRLWVNAGAARKLGIAFPASILARADRVFQ